jgi:uncharacterized protein
MRRLVNLMLVGGTALILLLSGGLIWFTYTQAYTLVRPGRLPLNGSPADYGINTWEDVTFASDDLTLHGWFVPPAAQGPALIIVHGLGAHRGSMLGQAALLHQQGYGVLLFDLRNHGASEGDITTLGYLEAQDVRAALDYVRGRADVDPDRVGLIGESMGGAAVLRAAAQRPDARVVVVESTFTSLEDNVAASIRDDFRLPAYPLTSLHLWFTGREGGFPAADLRPIDALADITQPLLIMHGDADELLPVANAERLYAAAQDPKELVIFPGAAHAGLHFQDPERFEAALLPFLRMYL